MILEINIGNVGRRDGLTKSHEVHPLRFADVAVELMHIIQSILGPSL